MRGMGKRGIANLTMPEIKYLMGSNKGGKKKVVKTSILLNFHQRNGLNLSIVRDKNILLLDAINIDAMTSTNISRKYFLSSQHTYHHQY